ncbi:hypothetical protein ACSDQ9_11965 [Aestuariimicrobium soli]|uniref:hypothetical protein n=1 Tax=Aestuariimicrobium soli TaxID=2035834 RepID=UPI003EBE335D
MRFYARGWRATRQAGGDIIVLAWVVVWVWLGTVVHGVINELAGPARQTAKTSGELAARMREASGQLGRVPGVGDQLARPFDGMAGDLDQLVTQANGQVATIGTVAWVMGVLTAAAPIALVLLLWLPRRVSFARNSAAAQKFIDADADLDLFALRAMANQPMPVLANISNDPMGAWRRRDREVIRKLAKLELDRVGLSMPAPTALRSGTATPEQPDR